MYGLLCPREEFLFLDLLIKFYSCPLKYRAFDFNFRGEKRTRKFARYIYRLRTGTLYSTRFQMSSRTAFFFCILCTKCFPGFYLFLRFSHLFFFLRKWYCVFFCEFSINFTTHYETVTICNFLDLILGSKSGVF